MQDFDFSEFRENWVCKEPLAGVFEALRLPEPDTNSIAEISWGNLIPLEDYGCVLRFEWHSKNIRNFTPYMVQPIAQIGSASEKYLDSRKNDLSDLELVTRSSSQDVELVPGFGNVGIDEDDWSKLKGLFRRTTSCDFQADAQNDCAYFGPRTEKFPNGLPVVIDRTDVRGPDHVEITDYARSILKGLVPRRSKLARAWSERYGDLAVAELYRQVQIQKYGNLTRLARRLLTAPEEERDARAAVFWREMRANVGRIDRYGDEVLGAGWLKHEVPDYDYAQKDKISAVCLASRAYSDILRGDQFHSAIIDGSAYQLERDAPVDSLAP